MQEKTYTNMFFDCDAVTTVLFALCLCINTFMTVVFEYWFSLIWAYTWDLHTWARSTLLRDAFEEKGILSTIRIRDISIRR